MLENYELGNYEKEEVKINVVWANVFAIIMIIPVIIIFGIPYVFIWKETLVNDIVASSYSLRFWLALIGGIILHELIHGSFWAIFTKEGFKSIKFGIMPASKLFSPYCHCKEPLKLNHYRLGAIMPLMILGIIPTIISICIGSLFLFALGIIFITAAGGDILLFQKTLKESKDSLIFDHPSDVGYDIYRLKSNE